MSAMEDRGRLLVTCPDRRGIVAAVSRFLFDQGANIIHSDQHTTDPAGGRFFLRVEFDLAGLTERSSAIEAAFGSIAAEYGMVWRLTRAAVPKHLAILVSKEEHCLLELLWHLRADGIAAEIALVISNHTTLAPLVAPWGIPFHHVPVGPDPTAREDVERRQLALIEAAGVDLIVLARYMQILSPAFIAG